LKRLKEPENFLKLSTTVLDYQFNALYQFNRRDWMELHKLYWIHWQLRRANLWRCILDLQK